VQGSFVSEDLERREDDVTWRVRCHGMSGSTSICWSRSNPSPTPGWPGAYSVYVGLIYQQLVRTGNLSTQGRLPPVTGRGEFRVTPPAQPPPGPRSSGSSWPLL